MANIQDVYGHLKTLTKKWFYDKTEMDSKLSKKKSHYYGTCSTSGNEQVKEVTSTDFVLSIGVVLSVKFTNANTFSGITTLKINDSENEINVAPVIGTTSSRYYWKAGEVVTFIYDGYEFIIAEGGNATTTYYGVTKLSSSTSSTSEALSATPKAVKTAYDLANGKQDALVSGTNIKTINNNSLLGSGNINISGGGSSVDIVTSWETTLSDSKVPSEKLVKNSLDGKSNSNHTHNLMDLDQGTIHGVTILADGRDVYGEGVGLFDDNLIYSNVENKIYYRDDGSDPNQELAVKGDIPSLTNYVQKSQATGLIKNDGTIMQSGTGASNFALGNHTHSGYANSSHNHNISDLNNITTVTVTVTYIDNTTETINLVKYTGS